MIINKVITSLICLSAISANASTIKINNKGCTTDAIYKTISSTKKIEIKNDNYNSSGIYTESGIIKANTDKEINIENPKNKNKVQIIFIDNINNSDGKKATMQLWLTKNKLCMITDKKQCYKVDLTTPSSLSDSGIQLCTTTVSKQNQINSNVETVNGKQLEPIK